MVASRKQNHFFPGFDNPSERLNRIVDAGTVDRMKAEEFYSTNDDYMRLFKNLLRNSFIEKVRGVGIELVGATGVFRFATNKDRPRAIKITWKAINTSQKTVVFELRNKAKTHIVCFRHLAFKAFFYDFGQRWYISVTPTWSFTSDGHRTSRFESNYLSRIKRLEGNESVYYFFRFLAYYLSLNEMFTSTYEHLIIKPASAFRFAPIIEDSKAWLPMIFFSLAFSSPKAFTSGSIL